MRNDKESNVKSRAEKFFVSYFVDLRSLPVPSCYTSLFRKRNTKVCHNLTGCFRLLVMSYFLINFAMKKENFWK